MLLPDYMLYVVCCTVYVVCCTDMCYGVRILCLFFTQAVGIVNDDDSLSCFYAVPYHLIDDSIRMVFQLA